MSNFNVRFSGSVEPAQHEAIQAEHDKLVKALAALDENTQGSFGTDQTDGSGFTGYSSLVTGSPAGECNAEVKAAFESAVRAVRALDPHLSGGYSSSDPTGDVVGTSGEVE